MNKKIIAFLILAFITLPIWTVGMFWLIDTYASRTAATWFFVGYITATLLSLLSRAAEKSVSKL